MNLALFGIDPGAAVPERFSHWRPLVRDAVDVFLGGLSAKRVQSMIQAQEALRQNASKEHRLAVIMLESPLLHKLGQVLSRHPALNRPIRKQLQRLEMLAPTHRLADIRDDIFHELGDAAERYSVELTGEPLAEGSVAIVVPCRWTPKSSKTPQNGVLKILRRGVIGRLEEDLRVLNDVMEYLDRHKAEYDIPGMAYKDTLESVRDLLRSEILLADEQRHMREAARVFAHTPRVKVPKLLPFCTPRMTAMERLHGQRVTDVPNELPSASQTLSRRELADTIVEALISNGVFSKETAPLYHADPHAGNLWATEDGYLGLLDWSLVGRLEKRHRETLALIALGALRLSRRQVEAGILRLSDHPTDPKLIRPAVNQALRKVRRGQLPGLLWLTDLLEDAAAQGLIFPPNLVLFRKSLFTIRGVLADLDPGRSADWLFLKQAVLRFASEMPSRALALPFSRKFSTHLSNVDLLRTYLATPLTLSRFWMGTLRDLVPIS